MPEEHDDLLKENGVDGQELQKPVDRRGFAKTLTGVALGLAAGAALTPTAQASTTARNKILDRIQGDLTAANPDIFSDVYDKGPTGDHYSK